MLSDYFSITPPLNAVNFAFLTFLLFGIAFGPSLKAQGLECGVDVPTKIVEELISKQALIEEFAANLKTQQAPPPQNPVAIPVRFTNFGGTGAFHLSQAFVDVAISKLNTAFASAGLTFFQCGEINEVWDDRIMANLDIDKFTTSFAYATGTIEIYITASGTKPLAPIPEQAYAQGNPNFIQAGAYEHTNFVKLTTTSHLINSTVIHEVGHHFGLLHTFMVSSTDYNSPPPTGANDHPYVVEDYPGHISPNWWGRELVIRSSPVPPVSKDFPTPNFAITGDLVEDTPSDCSYASSNIFPGCPLIAQNLPGCDFNSNLTYKDYNGDAIYPAPSGYSLGRNYMSYWNDQCLNNFTPKQIERVQYYYENERKPIYTPDRCGTFTDNVEFEGTQVGLHDVSIRIRHSGSSQKCNVTSSLEGKFSGVLHQDMLKSYVYLNGKRNVLNFSTDPLKIHYDHSRCEWVRGVTVGDVGKILQHINGSVPFTDGYQWIAADADKNNLVTSFDGAELYKLILGIYMDYLPNHEQPFRYIPEFVPQTFSNQFNVNPFVLFNGAYLEQGWEYPIPNDGQRGFDGIKIGDVNKSWLPQPGSPSPECPSEFSEPGGGNENSGGNVTLTIPTTSLTQNDVVALNIKIQSAQQLAGFQMGLKLPASQFEVLDVITNTGSAPLQDYTKENNFGLNLSDPDILTTLWVNPNANALQLPMGATLFKLVVKAKENIPNLQSAIALNNEITPAIFLPSFTVQTPAAAELVIQVEPATGHRSAKSESVATPGLNIEPNPVHDAATISFYNNGPLAQGAISIKNVSGVSVFTQQVALETGKNVFVVSALESMPTGVYTVTLNMGGQAYSSKVIKQ